MNRAQKYLIDNNLSDLIINESERLLNKHSIPKYVSDVMMEYSDNISYLKNQAIDILNDIHKDKMTVSKITYSDIEFYSYPQTFNTTNPNNNVGGNAMTVYNIMAFHNTLFGDCVLFVGNDHKYYENFKPFMRY